MAVVEDILASRSKACSGSSACTCCDDRCVKAIAANECQAAGQGHLQDAEVEGACGSDACAEHLRNAFDKYASYLRQALCICETVVANAQSARCCDSRSQQIDENVALSTACSAVGPDSSGVRSRRSQEQRSESDKRSYNRQHPSRMIPPVAISQATFPPSPIAATSACATTSAQAKGTSSCCKSRAKKEQAPASSGTDDRSIDHDVEQDRTIEHVTVRVIGMTCSTCAPLVARALQSGRGVSNVHVTFITSVAEFDVNTSLNSITAVIEHAESATGFSLSKLTPDRSTLDIFMDADQEQRYQDSLPPGVLQCQRLSKQVVQIAYDPAYMGARDVLRSTNSSLAPLQDCSLAVGRARLYRTLSLTCLAAIFTIPVVVLAWANVSVSETSRLIIQLVLASVVQALAYPEFYKPAVLALIRDRVIEMDMLVVISITAAYCYSVVAFGFAVAGHPLEVEGFFETSTLLITLVFAGRLVTAYARKAAISAVSLRSLQPQQAILGTETIDARLLHFGDHITIPAHAQIVTDAIVLEGSSEINEAMLTGESMPVPKTIGDSITAGTLNGQGKLKAKVVRLTGKNTISDITDLVDEAQKSQPRVQELADKIASYFVPVVVAIAVAVVVIWTIVGVKRGDGPSAFGLAISYGIAVLAVSCPCALGLAVPMVLVVAGGVASRAGIIIKAADVTERGHKITDAVFDKTGTLTEGTMTVVDQVITQHIDSIPSIIKSLVKGNNHPISMAIDAALDCNVDELVENIVSEPGSGITASLHGAKLQAGSPHWLGVDRHAAVLSLFARRLSVFCVTLDSQLIALYGLEAKMRDEAEQVVRELQRRDIQVHVVSGDNRNAVEAAAEALGIPIANVVARASPESKRDYIRELNSAGKMTLFCGDGTNDAVAVAQARVGVHIGSSDMTRAAADVVLLGDLGGVISLLEISKAAYRRIVFNFIWSAIYNILAISLAAGAFVKVRIPPAYAGLGEIVSVLPVIAIGSTMVWYTR